MAQLFPMHAADAGGQDDRPSLAGTLLTLPDPWTLLRDRRIGGIDGAEAIDIDIVLVHPAIGVALIDEAPRDPSSAIAMLRAYLDGQRFAEFFPGELPIVALSIAPAEFPEIGDRLADAFATATDLSIADADWADAVIELLLMADDLTMARASADAFADERPIDERPIEEEPVEEEPVEEEPVWDEPGDAMPPLAEPIAARHLPFERSVETAPFDHLRAPTMVDWPFSPDDEEPPPRRRRWIAATALVVIPLAALAMGAWLLDMEEPMTADAPVAATDAVELPLAQQPTTDRPTTEAPQSTPPAVPSVPPAAPVVLAAKPFAPLPPAAPIATPVEPLPSLAEIKPTEAAPPPAAPMPPPPTPRSPPVASASPAPATTAPTAPVAQSTPQPQATAPPPRKPTTVAPANRPPAAAGTRLAVQAPRPPAAVPPPRREVRATPSAPARAAPGAEGPPIDAADLPPLDAAEPEIAPRQDTVPAAAPGSGTSLAAARPPAAAIDPPTALAATSSNPRECRPYTAATTLAGRGVPVQGTACRDADGEWRLVSEVPLR